MTAEACADKVRRGDPDRFLATMAAPPRLRAGLFVLYAFNLEVARAPWVSDQPLIGAMRLQFWRDVVTGDTPRAHEVAAPLHALIREARLPEATLLRLIDAREAEIESRAFDGADALSTYLDDTAAGLMALAGRVCAAPEGAEPALRALGWAGGLAAYLAAQPAFAAHGRAPLANLSPDDLRALAGTGLARIDEARRAGPLGPAALAAWQAVPILVQVQRDPARVAEGSLGTSEFVRRGRLLWQALTGRV